MMENNNKPIFLTPSGYERVNLELENLKSVKRVQVTNRLKQVGHVDGNDFDYEYYSAREEQAFVEGRIKYLELLLSTATIVQPGSGEEIILGSTVTFQQEGFDPETYTIVGSVEANPIANVISNESPLGQALIGRVTGEEIEVLTPSGNARYLILTIV